MNIISYKKADPGKESALKFYDLSKKLTSFSAISQFHDNLIGMLKPADHGLEQMLGNIRIALYNLEKFIAREAPAS